MRLFLVAALAVTAFVATMAIQTTDANAVVARGSAIRKAALRLFGLLRLLGVVLSIAKRAVCRRAALCASPIDRQLV
jgi:hypothetical protein